jgi:hypothetical protein
VAGTYAAPQNVALSSATTDAMIYYTTNGTTPTAASTQYSSPIAVDASEKLEAIAISPTLGTSNVESAAYVIQTPVPATFALSGTAISIASPGAAGNSTITITPSGGFTGTVAITCAVTSSPSGAIDPPTCSATQPSAITGGTAATSTLSVNTTAASTAALHIPLERIFTLGGGGTLAALLLFGLPFRRRKWQMLFSLLVFLAIASAAIGCGGPSVTTKQPSGGTTAGSYTVTVTGTSGSTKATTAVAVTVE